MSHILRISYIVFRCRVFFFLAIMTTAGSAYSQTRTIDRLKTEIQHAQTPAIRLRAVLLLCDQGYSLHPDTLMAYAKKAEAMAHAQQNLHDEISARYYQSFAFTNKALIDSSLDMANECLQILSGKVDDLVLKANLLNQKGRCFMRKSQYKEAIAMGYQVIDVAEKARDTLLQMKGKTLIGWAYLEMGQPKEALSWHLKALQTTSDTVLIEKYGILFANLALNYSNLGKNDSSLYYIQKAVRYSRNQENLFALSNSLAIQAQLYVRSGQGRQAEGPLEEVVAIRKLIGDPFYIISDMSQLSLFYAHNGEPAKGIALCNEGIAIARHYNLYTKLFFLYGTLAENYKAQGNNRKYAQVLEHIISLKDSVYHTNSAEVLAEMQTKYDLQKKENLIIRQQLDITRKNYLFYGLLLLLLFTAVIALLLFRGYKRRQKIKLHEMKEEEKLLSSLAIINAEENERKRIAADLHDNLGAYAAAILSNLDHIMLQYPGSQNNIALQELRNNSQSIVSQLSDTIWALKKDALSLTAISDRLKTFIQRIQSSYPDIRMDVLENIAVDHLLPPSQAFHLFQVVREAIINALRHSGCMHITVIIESARNWKININDDGTGISKDQKLNGSGNGLSNMKIRSEEAGWNIEWQKGSSRGTFVMIEPTTN